MERHDGVGICDQGFLAALPVPVGPTASSRPVVVILALALLAVASGCTTARLAASNVSGAPVSTVALRAVAAPSPAPATSSNGFGRTLLSDTTFVATAPSRWDGRDWLKLGLGTLAVAATMPFDESIAHHAQSARTPTSDRIASFVEPFGQYGAFGVIGGFYVVGSVLHDDEAKNVAVDGLISSIIAGAIITPLIKEIAGRGRPSTTGGEENVYHPFSGSASFPSGHTTEAFAVASVIASHYDKAWVKALSYGLAGLVGLARMDHDAHFASDVLAGALIGTVVGKTVVHLDDERRGAPGAPSLTAGPFYTRDGPGVAVHLHF
jgi:membrane-associated phospholipid phosphatase